MIEFRPSKDPKFPFEAAPEEWDRRIFLFTLKEMEAFQSMSPAQRELMRINKKARGEYRIRNTVSFHKVGK